MIIFATLPQVFLQECMMSAYFLLINAVPSHAANDLNLHSCIVKINSLLSNISKQSMGASFCSRAHSRCGLDPILWSWFLLYFAHFSSLLNGNRSWTGLFIS